MVFPQRIVSKKVVAVHMPNKVLLGVISLAGMAAFVFVFTGVNLDMLLDV